jgi:4-hydroxybenzoate polyprenyltransferase
MWRVIAAKEEEIIMGLLSLLWTIAVILVVLWLIGLIVHIGGAFIHILLIVAVIVIVYNLIMHSRSRRV